MQTLGELDPMEHDNATALTSSGGYTLLFDAQSSKLVARHSGVVRRFQGLPRPVWSGGHFTTPGCGMRWSGTASVRLPNSTTLLQTAIVTFAGQPVLPQGRGQNATSVVLFSSGDGGVVWNYLATIADAKEYPESWEGTLEMESVHGASHRMPPQRASQRAECCAQGITTAAAATISTTTAAAAATTTIC